MSRFTSAPLTLLLTCSWIIAVSGEPLVIRVGHGQDVTLPCQTGDVTIIVAEWIRSEPQPPKNILLYRDGQIRSPIKGRVELGDLKTGNVSLILKKVNREDVGTYECRVLTAGSRRKKRAINTDPISRVELQVTDPETEVIVGRVGQDAGLPCDAGDGTIIVAEWIRSEPQPSKDILIYRDRLIDPTRQPSSFTGRVQLVDDQLKTRDVSLILKDVSREDVGTYECRVLTAGSGRNKTETVSIIRLLVTETEVIVARVGQDAGLPCDAGDGTIIDVEWIRSDLKPPKDILVYRDRLIDPTRQPSSFTGRVQLVDGDPKTGDASLILKDVSREDVGTYECRVLTAGSGRNKRNDEPISIIRLLVTDPVSQNASAVELYEGDPLVLLPCKSQTFELHRPSVVWSRYDLDPSTVHQRQQKGDELKDQIHLYSGRTSMKTDALETGDLSLHLTKLQVSDSGSYTCTVRGFSKGRHRELRVTDVHLQVKERFPSWAKALLVLLVLLGLGLLAGAVYQCFRQYFTSVCQVEVDSEVESVQLPCKTTVHLPKDIKVQWEDRNNRKVHVYQNGSDQPEEQDDVYRGRTEMKRKLKIPGDLSLTLRYPTDTDTYTCTVYNREGRKLMKKHVVLKVKGCQVEVEEGEESVQLPFRTTPDLPEDATVVWYCWKPSYRTVHLYENRSDRPEKQHQVYKDRTEMKNLLKTGDLSLTLKHPKETDTGEYWCRVVNKDGDELRVKTVKLKVKGCQVEVEEGEESVQLPFRTAPDLPEDATVMWYRYEPSYSTVHAYENRSDKLEEQHQDYKDRTEMKKDLLKTGDLSLTLKHPKETDTGRYSCTVINKNVYMLREKTVELKVKGNIRNRSSSTDPTPLMADQSV